MDVMLAILMLQDEFMTTLILITSPRLTRWFNGLEEGHCELNGHFNLLLISVFPIISTSHKFNGFSLRK